MISFGDLPEGAPERVAESQRRAERLTINRKTTDELRGHARRLRHLVEADPLELLALQMAPRCALEGLNE